MLIHKGDYMVKGDVELVEDERGWSPYLSAADAIKLDDVREPLRRGDVAAAASVAHVFELHPAAAR